MKFSAPISSGKLEFMSGKSLGIVKEFCSVLCVGTLFNPINFSCALFSRKKYLRKLFPTQFWYICLNYNNETS